MENQKFIKIRELHLKSEDILVQTTIVRKKGAGAHLIIFPTEADAYLKKNNATIEKLTKPLKTTHFIERFFCCYNENIYKAVTLVRKQAFSITLICENVRTATEALFTVTIHLKLQLNDTERIAKEYEQLNKKMLLEQMNDLLQRNIKNTFSKITDNERLQGEGLNNAEIGALLDTIIHSSPDKGITFLNELKVEVNSAEVESMLRMKSEHSKQIDVGNEKLRILRKSAELEVEEAKIIAAKKSNIATIKHELSQQPSHWPIIIKNATSSIGVLFYSYEENGQLQEEAIGTGWMLSNKLCVTNAHVYKTYEYQKNVKNATLHIRFQKGLAEKASRESEVRFMQVHEKYRLHEDAPIHQKSRTGAPVIKGLAGVYDIAIGELVKPQPHYLKLLDNDQLLKFASTPQGVELAALGYSKDSYKKGSLNLNNPSIRLKQGKVEKMTNWWIDPSSKTFNDKFLIDISMGISGGFSGAPLIDLSGKVVGLIFATEVDGKGGTSGVNTAYAQRIDIIKELLKTPLIEKSCKF